MHFERGNTFGVAGCPVGAKNKLSRAFREALLADFEEHGAAAIRVVRTEEPAKYLSIIASIEPRQLRYEGVERGLSLEELDARDALLIEMERQVVATDPALAAPKEKPTIRVTSVPRISHEKETEHSTRS